MTVPLDTGAHLPEDAAAASRDPSRRFADGRYILVQEVGHGGMGVVWKAWQTDLRRPVAVKILVGTSWTDVELKRFYREARMAAALSHANIASIYEVGEFDHKHFIAMEFVDGESLARLIASATARHGTARVVKLAPRRAAEILREAALAVDYAHSKQIIHRDLKPHNIMVSRQEGRVYVMDFGLAKPIRTQDSLSRSDDIVGTPQYMSPEQARGNPLDPRTDVYSLGAVLYHMLTGRPPFEGSSPADTLMSVLADDPLPPRRLNPRLHPDLETICMKALEKGRRRRYDSARSFADDLGRYLDGEAISARPPSAREKFWKEVRQRPVLSGVVVAAAAAALLMSATFAGMSWRMQSRVDHLNREAEDAFVRGDYEDSKTRWEKVLTLDPEHAIALQRKSLCEKKIQSKAEERRKEIQSYRDVGDSFINAGKYEKAIRYFERILALDPFDVDAQERKQHCDAQLARDAEQDVKRDQHLMKIEKDFLDFKEKERLQNEKRKRATPFYEKARVAEVRAARMRLQAGGGAYTIAQVMGKYREAADALTRAIGEDDSYTEAFYFRGQIWQRIGDYARAEQDFQRAMQVGSESGPAAFGAAITHLTVSMMHAYAPYVTDSAAHAAAREKMLAAARKAKRSPSIFQHFSAIALEDLHQHNTEEALDAMDKVANEDEGLGNFSYHFIRACIHIEDGNDKEAFRELTSALDLDPVSTGALFLRAMVRERRQDREGALEDITLAVEVSKPNYMIYLLRAHLHETLSHRAEAVGDLDLAAKHAGPLAGDIKAQSRKLARDP